MKKLKKKYNNVTTVINEFILQCDTEADVYVDWSVYYRHTHYNTTLSSIWVTKEMIDDTLKVQILNLNR
jgi:hypothetical protein